jgi:hypothetical protein
MRIGLQPNVSEAVSASIIRADLMIDTTAPYWCALGGGYQSAGINTTDSRVIHHISPENGGRNSLRNVGL